MTLDTRAKKREPVQALAEYSIDECTEKTIKLNIPQSAIKCEGTEVVFVKSQLLDVSVGGCALDSPYIIPPGVLLDIKIDPKLFTIETGKGHEEPMRMIGRVTSCVMRTTGHYRLGIFFTKIEKEDLELVDSFIRSKERRKTPRSDMTR